MPVDAGPGTELMAGTLNGNGRLVFRVLRSGAESALERVILMVREAQRETAPIQRLADRVSEVFVPAVLVIAALTALGWMAGGAESETVLRRFVTVVIVACPCALGLATPTAILVGTGIGARMGLLVRGASALERAEQITHVALDKTGTLTHGTPEITRVVGDVLELAARAEQPSEHPLAGAVLARARQEGVALTAPESFEALPGLGVRADVEGRAVRVGSLRFLRQEGVSGLGQLELDAAEARSLGESLLFVAVDGCARGFLAASDPARPEAGAVVDWLVRRGLSVHVLSGDSEPAVRAVAVGLGIGDEAVHASLLPGDKLSVLEELRGGGATVAMVGDGINDAPSLAAADLGIALGGGADVALEAADVALMSADLRGVARTIALGTATLRTVRQNLAWAFAYNLLLIPVAAGALVPVGVEIGPAWAAAAMAMSSVTVVANALRLRRVDVSLAGELA